MSKRPSSSPSKSSTDDDIVNSLADQLASTTIQDPPASSPKPSRPIHPPSIPVYRAALVGMDWDTVLTHPFPFLFPNRPPFMLFSRGDQDHSGVSIEAHVNMGFFNSARNKQRELQSPWISFTKELNWSIYYALKQEIVFGEARQLIRLLVPESQLYKYTGTCPRTRAFTQAASECFGFVCVEAHEYSVLEIPQDVRAEFKRWAIGRRSFPFREWEQHAQARGLWYEDVEEDK